MIVTDILVGFHHLGRDPFPLHLCGAIVDDEVMNSTDDCYHLVFTVDDRFDCNGHLRKMKPYAVKEEDGTYYHGWVDADGNVVSHGEKPVYDYDHAKVVAWRPCPQDFDLRA